MKPSEKDLRAILALDTPGKGCKNYSIKAGAGGGKTTLLSSRICKQIIAGTPIEEFVIITYTNAAAAELRDKISDRLAEVVASSTASETERNNAKNAMNSIELMQISTIHSFLLKILRENAFETGIVLDAKMLEDEEDNARKEKFFNKWYHEHFDEIQKYKWIHKLKNNTERDVTYEVFFNMFTDIANVREDVMYDLADHTADFDKAAADYITAWLPKLILFKNTLMANRPVDGKGNPKKLNKDPGMIVEWIAEVEGKTTRGCDEAVTLSKAVAKINEFVKKDKSFYGAAGDNVPLLGVIPDIPECSLDWDFETLYNDFMLSSKKASEVVDYVCNMQKEYQKENDAETMSLSNDDILYRADKLLSNHPDVLDKLRGTYTKLYVDEFQDTTGLQARLVKMLSENIGTAPTANDLQEDKLIVVGDPKQSIYRFTGAEKAVYDEVDAMMAGMPATLAESVSLDTNFRSNKAVVDWVNDKFSKLMPSSYLPMDTDWVVSEPSALHGVYKYEADLGVDGKGEPVKYKKADDVTAVVELVNSLVDNTHCFVEEPVRNGIDSFDEPFLRKIQYSDIMIICKNTTNIKNYVEKFAEYGIPVNVQGKFKVSEDEILRNYVLLVEYLAGYKNKKKRLTAVQILYGLDASKVDADEIKKAESELNELRAYFRENAMDSAAIVRYLLSKEELYLPKGKLQDPERVREYRIRLNQMVETCLSNNDGDMSQLSSLMNDYIEKEIKREIPLDSNENAVRLMNVHQAKGLTGQIVIIADRSNDERCRYSGFKNDGKYYPTVSYKNSSGEFASTELVPAYGWDVKRLKQAYTEEMEESIRLQYVAATRAAHALIIMPLIYGRTYPNAWFSDEIYRYDSLPDVNEWIHDREADAKSYPIAPLTSSATHIKYNLQNLEANKSAADISKLSESQLISITPSGLEPEGVTGYAPSDSGYIKESRPGGNVFGTVMHKVYELIFIRYESLEKMATADREKAIERIINQAILENYDDMRAEDKPKEFFEFLKAKMLEYFDKVIAPIMADAEEIYPEYTFSFFVEDSERAAFIADFGTYLKRAKDAIIIGDEPIWVNGQADLVVKNKDGSIKVYDYKSDAMNGKAATAFVKSVQNKYEGQLALYRYAIGKSFGVSDVQTELIDLYR